MKKTYILLSILIIFNIQQIHSQPTCQSDETLFGDQCFLTSEIQECYDHLGLLDSEERYDPTHDQYGSVSNECEANLSAEGEYTYTFHVRYHAPYFHNSDCHTHQIFFTHPYLPEDFPFVEIPEGIAEFDEFTFTAETPDVNNDFMSGDLVYTVNHEDLVDTYMCDYFEEDIEYIWTCQMEHHILMGGVIQYAFPFHLTIILPRTTDATITTTVQKNLNLGDCCENTLDIASDLCFCQDHQCLPAEEGPCFSNQTLPYQLERLQIFYVRHFITTVEFQVYNLVNIEIMIGPFVPEVLDYDNSVPGQIIFKLRSNVALDLMTLKVTSVIYDNDSLTQSWQSTPDRRQLVANNRHRLLQNFNDDYYMQNTVTIKTLSPEEKEALPKQQFIQEQSSSILHFTFALLIAFFCLI